MVDPGLYPPLPLTGLLPRGYWETHCFCVFAVGMLDPCKSLLAVGSLFLLAYILHCYNLYHSFALNIGHVILVLLSICFVFKWRFVETQKPCLLCCCCFPHNCQLTRVLMWIVEGNPREQWAPLMTLQENTTASGTQSLGKLTVNHQLQAMLGPPGMTLMTLNRFETSKWPVRANIRTSILGPYPFPFTGSLLETPHH
jgi:hypothetical protein